MAKQGHAEAGPVVSHAMKKHPSAKIAGATANQAACDLTAAIVVDLKKNQRFTLRSFGPFKVAKTKARKAVNPRTGEPVRVKAGKSVRFKPSPVLRKSV